MRRFLPTARRLLAALAVGVVAGFAVAATISSPASATDSDAPQVYGGHGCVQLADARYVHKFNVDLTTLKATASIENVGPRLCAGLSQDFALVSYITKSGKFELPQYKFDSQVGTITHTDYKAEFEIKIPACFTQVDFVFGKEVLELDTDGQLYGHRKVGSSGAPGNQSTAKRDNPQHAWFNGGKKCEGRPDASGVSDCDGSMRVTLRTITGAFNTTFTILRGAAPAINVTMTPPDGGMKEVTVPPGDLSDVVVKVRGNVLTTLSWTRPTDCKPPTVTEEHDCDELRITVTNPEGNTPISARVDTPADATANAEAQIAAAAGDPVTINGGASHTFKMPASANLIVTVLIDGVKAKIVTYLKPAECGGGGGGLPTTGPRTSLMVGGGIGLVAIGAGLYLLFRRRQVTFTVG